MESGNLILDFDTWCGRYRPFGAPTEGQGTGFEIDGEDRMFETYGCDLLVVESTLRAAGPERIWTLMEFDGDRSIVAGFARVNRLGYFITENPWEVDSIQVSVS